MNRYSLTIALLICSNIFMTFAWYGHLKSMTHKPWIIAALVSWSIALVEYLFQVPANRIGHNVMSVGQLKILQEVITLLIFVPFSIIYLKEKLTLDYLWAGLCLLGAVFFLFRSKLMAA
ncbi:DMT family protein [Desulfobulbus oligotrophicus]|uniref:DMT family protein n=1 Tax=Desulfobulbus oligotrophicus TaxID=1909699 RepID=A0A7T5VCQ3_9BACT|nr:DMT family protein [Desulfobulbus oligotrophicus]QQG65364.1 DMT family protein [Desulfobulbus oligotrophicus]